MRLFSQRPVSRIYGEEWVRRIEQLRQAAGGRRGAALGVCNGAESGAAESELTIGPRRDSERQDTGDHHNPSRPDSELSSDGPGSEIALRVQASTVGGTVMIVGVRGQQ